MIADRGGFLFNATLPGIVRVENFLVFAALETTEGVVRRIERGLVHQHVANARRAIATTRLLAMVGDGCQNAVEAVEAPRLVACLPPPGRRC